MPPSRESQKQYLLCYMSSHLTWLKHTIILLLSDLLLYFVNHTQSASYSVNKNNFSIKNKEGMEIVHRCINYNDDLSFKDLKRFTSSIKKTAREQLGPARTDSSHMCNNNIVTRSGHDQFLYVSLRYYRMSANPAHSFIDMSAQAVQCYLANSYEKSLTESRFAMLLLLLQ